MKISKEEQGKTLNNILEAAVDIISEKGFKNATMRQIAKAAGIGEATIYNYFPNKEKLLYHYFQKVIEDVTEELKTLDGFNELPLKEQLFQLIELQLNKWLGAREFLREVFKYAFYSPVGALENMKGVRKSLDAIIIELLDAAIEAGEIPDQPYGEILPRLYWDYQTAIMAYWLNDDSEQFENTTKIINETTDIIAGLLHSALIGKAIDLASFIFRTHVLSKINELQEPLDGIKIMKRRFMGGLND